MTDKPWLNTYPSAVDWNAQIPVSPAFDLLARAEDLYGDKPGFDFLGKKFSWYDLHTLACKLAKGLQQQGIGKGMRVGLFLPNCPYFLIAYFAVLRTGATVTNYNPLYAERELLHQAKDSETTMMITLDLGMLYDKIKVLLDDEACTVNKVVICPFTDMLPFPKNHLFKVAKASERAHITYDDKHIKLKDLLNNDGVPAPVDINPVEDIAVLQYTGGTTGVPKGAMLTHANITANVEQVRLWFHEAKPGEEKMMGVLPFFHVFAMTAVMNLSVRLGFEIVALPRFDLDQTLKILDAKRPQYFPAVPAIYTAINHHPKKKKFDLSSLRFCISGGAPLPLDVKTNFEKTTGCILVEGYGLTESSPVAFVNPTDGSAPVNGSIGLPLPQTDVRLVDPETGKDVTSGEKGELWLKGPQVMTGYWNKPEETAATLNDGWLKTGDIAIMEESGYVRIVDRIKDMIITNGYNVYPRNVEEAIYLHTDVEECVVAGLPDDKRGEIVKAWIKPRKGVGLTSEDMRNFLEDKISKMEIPKVFEFRTSPLPKTLIGKLSRKALLEEERG